MALSQDEQRVLAEIERRLAADDPGLASCLTTFRRPGPGTVLRSPRARIIGSLFTVLLVAMISLMVYAMIPFRTHLPAQHSPAATTAGTPATTAISAATSSQPARTEHSSASVSTTAASSANATASSASRSAAAAGAQQVPVKPTTDAMLPGTGP